MDSEDHDDGKTGRSVGDEQEGSREAGNVGTSELKMVSEKYLRKDTKLYTAFMDFDKAYDRTERKSLWDVMRIYGVTRKLPDKISSLYKDEWICVCKCRVE